MFLKKTKLLLILPSILTQFGLWFVLGLVLSSLFFCSPSMANNGNGGNNGNKENNEDYVAYAKKQQEKVPTLIAPYKEQVEKIIKQVELKQAQPDIQAFKKELTSIVKPKYCSQKQGDVPTTFAPQLSTASSILIFVSFSMPQESIKGWITQAQKIGAAVYIRGLVNNSFKDTTKAIGRLVQDQQGGLLIDPNVFKKYSITQVPAVVVVGSNDFNVIYGDVTLDYALERISKVMQGDELQQLSTAVKKLRNNKFDIKTDKN